MDIAAFVAGIDPVILTAAAVIAAAAIIAAAVMLRRTSGKRLIKEKTRKGLFFTVRAETLQKYNNFNEKKFAKEQIKSNPEAYLALSESFSSRRNNSFDVRIVYRSPAGKNKYRKIRQVSFEEWAEYAESFMNRNPADRYSDILEQIDDPADREIVEKALAASEKQKERGKLSSKLRYEVFKRDGFRCVYCGRAAADGITLHADHIIPIAKGGQTVPENLQTLCSECNAGKSDDYEE